MKQQLTAYYRDLMLLSDQVTDEGEKEFIGTLEMMLGGVENGKPIDSAQLAGLQAALSYNAGYSEKYFSVVQFLELHHRDNQPKRVIDLSTGTGGVIPYTV
ncbi:hypothetical protein H6503_05195 [Candidatus Woesearchaeota archaeon]|nr:hypothetical protein [Candidatus Woesearchaeota archaeon]